MTPDEFETGSAVAGIRRDRLAPAVSQTRSPLSGQLEAIYCKAAKSCPEPGIDYPATWQEFERWFADDWLRR